MFCAANQHDSNFKKWCFLLKWMVTKNKNVWHKQECDQKGCDYKKGLLHFSSHGEPALTLICTTIFLPRACGGHITPNKY